jgi:RNA polymerase sigma-70 factor (ECF subfamily)
MHDVFLEAWRSAGDYDPARGSVRTWLLVRMRARCLDRVRSHGYSRTEPLPQRDEREDPESVSPELAADQSRVRAVLEILPETQRTVLELGYLHGLSFSEIAEKLDIPLGTVKSRASAALAKLRQELRGSNKGNAA